MNERLSLLTVLLLLGGAIVAAMLWLSADAETLHPTAAVDQPLLAVAAPADPSHSAVVEASTPASAAVTRDAAAAGASTPIPLPEDAEWIAITVVDKASGTPVPGACVHWFDYETAQRLAQDAPLSQQQRSIVEQDAERWAEQFGWHTTADSLGVARVAIGDAATVVARSETRYGSLELQRNTIAPREGYRLFLAADVEVLVRVLDDRGAPAADVMIALAVHNGTGEFENMWNWAPIAVTAADGLARVRHLQAIASSPDARPDSRGDKQWRVRLVLPGCFDPGVSLSITEPPAEPIVLRLPPCGRVRVRAEFAGQPMPGMKSAYLDNAEGENDEQGWAIEHLADADGWVRFPRVPLGRRYLAVTDSIGTMRANFAGPLATDQEVVVVLTPDRNDILLRGRIVDEERHPVAAQRFQVQARGPQFRSSSAFATDASGGFLVLLGPARGDNRVDQLGFVPVAREGVQKRVDAPPRELRTGVEDLGELVLGSGALLAAGHFRSGGLPHQKRVSFWVERRDTTTGRGERWRRQQGTLYNQSEDRFEVRGTLPPATYRLRFHAEGCLPIEPVPFAVGTTDLTVEIGVGHALAASVLLPEQTPESDLVAVLVAAEPAGKVSNARGNAGRQPEARPWGGEGGRYNLQWNALPAGSYALELRLWTHASPLLTVPDVQVPAPAGGDPRLVDVDLRALVRVLRIELLDTNGKLLEEADGVAFPAGQNPRAEWLGYRIDASQRLLVKPGPIEFIVTVAGHRPTPALATGDVLQVRLDAWPKVALTFPDLPALPPKVSLIASFEPTEKSDLPYRSQGNTGNRNDLMHARGHVAVVDGKADVPIGDGPHTLRLAMRGNRRSTALELPARQFLSTDGQARVVVPPEQWQKALEIMKQPPK